jgi:hypothetical protein
MWAVRKEADDMDEARGLAIPFCVGLGKERARIWKLPDTVKLGYHETLLVGGKKF